MKHLFSFFLLLFLQIKIFAFGITPDILIENINVDKGLCQSQVNAICVDKQNRVWCATIGGVSCFDGKNFTNYNLVSGLADNFCARINVDDSNRVWVATEKGISRIEKGKIKNYDLPADANHHYASSILIAQQTVFVIDEKLYQINSEKITSYTNASLAGKAVAHSRVIHNNIFVSTKDSFLFTFDKTFSLQQKIKTIGIASNFFEYQNQFYYSSNNKIYKTETGEEEKTLTDLISVYKPYQCHTSVLFNRKRIG